MTNDTTADDRTDAEQRAITLATQLKTYRTEANKWHTLAEHATGDAAEIAEAYRDVWMDLAEQRSAQLQDVDAELGFLEGLE